MSGAKQNPGALAGAAGAGKPIQANAEGTPHIPQREPARHIRGTPYTVTSTDDSIFTVAVSNLRRLLCLHRIRRLNRLRRLHRMYGLHRLNGLTEARAQAAATLFWGGVR